MDHEGNIIENKKKVQFLMDKDEGGNEERDMIIDAIDAIPFPMPKMKEIDKEIYRTIDIISSQQPQYIETSQSAAENDSE